MARKAKGTYKRRRYRQGRYLRGGVSVNKDLGTMQALDVQTEDMPEVVSERTRVSSLDCMWTTSGWIQSDDDGPIMVGVAHSGYTDAEIEGWIEDQDTWDEGDMQLRDVRQRLIRKIGVLTSPPTDGGSKSLNDGKPIKTRLNWVLSTGQTLQIWYYNMGNSAFGAPGPHVQTNGHVNLFVL